MTASAFTADQIALLAAIAHRPRTPGELATTLAEPVGDLERQLRVLAQRDVAEARMDKCPLCKHIFGGRVYSATDEGLRVVADSPLLRKAARA